MADLDKAISEWGKDFKSFVDELCMPKDDYKGIIEYINDGIELLKEKQPKEKQPQVLWIGQLTPGVFVYVEYVGMVRGQFVTARPNDNGVIYWAWENGYKGYDRIEDYGKLWRAWDKMPTDEQRKSVPWKDGEQK